MIKKLIKDIKERLQKAYKSVTSQFKQESRWSGRWNISFRGIYCGKGSPGSFAFSNCSFWRGRRNSITYLPALHAVIAEDCFMLEDVRLSQDSSSATTW